MMKSVALVFACLVVASSAQILLPGATTYSQESTVQSHAPWAASVSSRSQVHGPDATLVAAAPVHYAAPTLLAAAPVAAPTLIAAAPVHYAAPLAYLRR